MKNVVITILTVLVIVLGGYLIYDKFIAKDSNSTLAIDKKNDDKVDCIPATEQSDSQVNYDQVPTTDMYALAIDPETSSVQLQFYILKDGRLYYKLLNSITTDDYSYFYSYDYNPYEKKHNIKDLKEYKGLSNIKRIKGINFSSGQDFSLILITDDGEVYSLAIGYDMDGNIIKDTFVLQQIDDFKNYKVENILEYSPTTGCVGECKSSYKILLKDGETVSR